MASEAPKWAAKLDLNEHRSRVVSGHHVVSSSPKQVSIGGRVNKRAAEFMEEAFINSRLRTQLYLLLRRPEK